MSIKDVVTETVTGMLRRFEVVASGVVVPHVYDPALGALLDLDAGIRWADGVKTRPANTTAYAGYQVKGDANGSLYKFSNFFSKAGGRAAITEALLNISKAGGITPPAGIGVRQWFYSQAITDPGADGAVLPMLEANRVVTAAGALLGTNIRQGFLDLSTVIQGGAGSDAFQLSSGQVYTVVQAAPGSRDLWLVAMATAAFTPTASAVMIPGLRKLDL